MRWQSIFIAAFLAVQILAPLDYYGCRDDELDERFAWRMFSAERLVECRPTFWVGDGADRKPVQLGRTFHQAWIETARRGRIEVIKRMAARLCEENPAQPVRVSLPCIYRMHGEETFQRSKEYDLCLTGLLR